MVKVGSAYEKVTRNMVDNLSTDFKDFRVEMRKEFQELKQTNVTLYNHLSSRVPKEIANKLSLLTGILGTVIGGIVVGVIVSLVN